MTEAEWLAGTDPTAMLEFLRGKASDRKLRLFACSCCRRIWSLITDHRSRIAVEIAERFADCLASNSEREAAIEAASAAREEDLQVAWELFEDCLGGNPKAELPDNSALAALICVSGEGCELATEIDKAYRRATRRPGRRFKGVVTWMPNTDHIPEEGMDNTDLIRELFANPFRPVTVAPSWRTEAVVPLAEGIYVDKAFDRMPMLADALENAGCSHEGILSHCRGAGPHVKGCWVVDLLTSRK